MIRSLTGIFLSAALWLGVSWLAFHSVNISFDSAGDGTEMYRDCFLSGVVANAVLFFGVLYFFPRNEPRMGWAFLKQVGLLFVGLSLLERLVDDWVLGYFGHAPNASLRWEIWWTDLGGNLMVMLLGLVVGMVLDWFHQHRLARAVREQQMRTELDLLKSRINPHFLFNVLNGIFYTAHKNGDEETADAIARLSQMMRYMLHEVSAEWVPLAGELEYLENYIVMQRMRLTDAIAVTFEVQGAPGNVQVPPMLLLPFVENAFKHGVSIAHPTPISIVVRISDGVLDLEVANHVHGCAEQERGGLGLADVRRRLNLLYPGRHRLTAGAREGRYHVALQVPTRAAQATRTPARAVVCEEGTP